jgi:hypothetical protein
MKKTLNYIVVGLVLLALAGIFFAGYSVYPKVNKCPQTARDTVYVRDTTIYYIKDTIPYYDIHRDTVIYNDTIPVNIDTSAILEDYFAFHYFTRTWTDSLLTVTLTDVVSRNSLLDNTFAYTILRPQQVINNVINNYSYGKYIIAGVDVPMKDIKYVNIDVMFVTRRWYAGVGYNIYLNSPTLKAGATLFKFK